MRRLVRTPPFRCRPRTGGWPWCADAGKASEQVVGGPQRDDTRHDRLALLTDQAAGGERGARRAGRPVERRDRRRCPISSPRTAASRCEIGQPPCELDCAEAAVAAGPAFRPARWPPARSRIVASKKASGSRMVLRQCPKTSRLMMPTRVVQACTNRTTISARACRGRALRRPAPPLAAARRTGAGGASGRAAAGRFRLDRGTGQGRGDAGVGLDGVLGRLVPGHRGAEDEAPFVRALERPPSDGARHREPAFGVGWPRASWAVRRPPARPRPPATRTPP